MSYDIYGPMPDDEPREKNGPRAEDEALEDSAPFTCRINQTQHDWTWDIADTDLDLYRVRRTCRACRFSDSCASSFPLPRCICFDWSKWVITSDRVRTLDCLCTVCGLHHRVTTALYDLLLERPRRRIVELPASSFRDAPTWVTITDPADDVPPQRTWWKRMMSKLFPKPTWGAFTRSRP